jgi:dihydrofolate reductase
VFVLTHFPHPSIEMKGGTMFHFVDTGIEAALDRALEAAVGQDVVVGGGAATVRQYLSARLVDDLHLVLVPILLGSGERLFENVGVDFNDYACVDHVSSSAVTHVHLSRVTVS